jgi:DNA polymerase
MDLQTLQDMAALCRDCELYEGRLNPVFAKGNPVAEIMICGMVPADEENKVGLPFVGRAGKLLDKILIDSSLTMDDVYITNLVKCYLSAGLALKSNWIDACLSYLIVQINIIQPKVILTLGKDSSITLLGLDHKISLGSIVGREFEYGNAKVIPTYHPSYLLRGGGEKHKNYSNVIKDFNLAKELSNR